MIDLGTAIRTYRTKSGLSMRGFGARVGLTGASIYLLEQGADPSVAALRRIAVEIGLSASDLGAIIIGEPPRRVRRTGTDG